MITWAFVTVWKILINVCQSTDHHADAVLLSSRAHLQRVIHHQVHKGVKPPQDALHMSAPIQLHWRIKDRRKISLAVFTWSLIYKTTPYEHQLVQAGRN